MQPTVHDLAQSLSRQHSDRPRVILGAADTISANHWRAECRRAGVPVLELRGAAASATREWLDAALAFSCEFMMPVVVFSDTAANLAMAAHQALCPTVLVDDPDWLRTRQVALTRGVETSPLNQEYRRTRDRHGWIRFGWQPDTVLAEGNGLLLAWSSPLPLLRIRNFAARCPEITLYGPDAEAIAAEVAAQGISVTGWRFAVK